MEKKTVRKEEEAEGEGEGDEEIVHYQLFDVLVCEDF